MVPVNPFFENANRRFLFTMKNRTQYKFILNGSGKECGIIDAPVPELNVGTMEKTAQLQIRGYKRSYALYGVTYTVHFRILDAREKDTGYKLQIFLAVGEVATNNYFGWYVYDGRDDILTPLEWKARLSSSRGYNRNKENYGDNVLNMGGMYALRATIDALEMEIEMTTDNQSHSTPSMMIRPIVS